MAVSLFRLPTQSDFLMDLIPLFSNQPIRRAHFKYKIKDPFYKLYPSVAEKDKYEIQKLYVYAYIYTGSRDHIRFKS